MEDTRISSPKITNYEFTRILGIRVQQIKEGAFIDPQFVDLRDPMEIAKAEIKNNLCPIKIVRWISPEKKEEYHLSELVINPKYYEI